MFKSKDGFILLFHLLPLEDVFLVVGGVPFIELLGCHWVGVEVGEPVALLFVGLRGRNPVLFLFDFPVVVPSAFISPSISLGLLLLSLRAPSPQARLSFCLPATAGPASRWAAFAVSVLFVVPLISVLAPPSLLKVLFPLSVFGFLLLVAIVFEFERVLIRLFPLSFVALVPSIVAHFVVLASFLVPALQVPLFFPLLGLLVVFGLVGVVPGRGPGARPAMVLVLSLAPLLVVGPAVSVVVAVRAGTPGAPTVTAALVLVVHMW